MKKLKLCPFCGGEVRIVSVQLHYSGAYEGTIECERCRALINFSGVGESKSSQEVREIITEKNEHAGRRNCFSSL